MHKKTSRALKMVSGLFVAVLSTAAHADVLYQCQLNQTLWSEYDNCMTHCSSQQWIPDASNPNGGYWNTSWYGCMDVYNSGSGGSSGGGGSGGGGGGSGGGWSDPFYQGQCDYNVMCPGANSCLCKGTGGEQQST
ncbi:hypothetical protein CYFUS_009215 [Cystobacter fuscus]|uniref:Lipoprotein n=1 Tax=Cystobacter fuscus TaxID=43 RepID=A0A250JIM2_9BACT|nr:hypothetical protein [Cystobacter fuscus]ATB43735.1 hypothetical protein CYFUS_009215 [Cystobacter fuscus]AYM53263.1 hypothetical protein [Cystobacter fuscus]